MGTVCDLRGWRWRLVAREMLRKAMEMWGDRESKSWRNRAMSSARERIAEGGGRRATRYLRTGSVTMMKLVEERGHP